MATHLGRALYNGLRPLMRNRQFTVDPIKKWKITRGDFVEVVSGADRGAQGMVSKVLRRENRVIVEGVNHKKKHLKPQAEQPGRVVEVEAPMHISNVALVDPTDGKPCRVCYRFTEDGTKVRMSRRTGSVIPRAEMLTERKTPVKAASPMDTPQIVAEKVTHEPAAAAAAAPVAQTV